MDTPVTPLPARSPDPDGEPRPGWIRRATRTLLSPPGIVTVVVLAAVVVIAMFTELGSEPPDSQPTDLPEAITQLIPSTGALVSPTSPVGVDFAPGYTGRLVIDGKDIPDDQLSRLGVTRVLFEPGDLPCLQTPGQAGGTAAPTPCKPEPKDIERFTGGQHSVTVVYWPTGRSEREGSSSYTWEFRVGV